MESEFTNLCYHDLYHNNNVIEDYSAYYKKNKTVLNTGADFREFLKDELGLTHINFNILLRISDKNKWMLAKIKYGI
jgi:hypothetical protein